MSGPHLQDVIKHFHDKYLDQTVSIFDLLNDMALELDDIHGQLDKHWIPGSKIDSY